MNFKNISDGVETHVGISELYHCHTAEVEERVGGGRGVPAKVETTAVLNQRPVGTLGP